MRFRGVVLGVLLLWACGTQNVPDGRLSGDAQTTDRATAAEAVVGADRPRGEPGASISLTKQVQPIFSASCGGASCHLGASPNTPDLEPGKAYAALVNQHSTECPQLMQVKPGDPTQSYLAIKIAGSGSCFKGTKMPPGGTLASSDASTITTWITAGAPNN